ncbi:MAG: hypothetical protein ABJA98_12805 [Acidobacteriota bacterium]
MARSRKKRKASPSTDGPLPDGPHDHAFASSDAPPDTLEPIARPAPPADWPEVPPTPNPPREHQRSARAPLLDLLVTPLTIGVAALLLPMSWLSRRSRSKRVVPRAGR